MGNSASTQSSSTNVSTDVTNVILQQLQNCGGNTQATQSNVITDSNVSGSDFSQTASVSFSCLSSSTTMDSLQAQIASAISQSATQSSVADATGGSLTSDTAIQNAVTNNFSSSNIQNCFANMQALQNNVITGSTITDSQFTQELTESTSCVGNYVNNVLNSAGLTAQATNTASNTSTNPLDFLDSIFSGFGEDIGIGIGIFIFIIFIIIIAIVAMNHHSTPPPQMSRYGPGMSPPPYRPYQPYRSEGYGM